MNARAQCPGTKSTAPEAVKCRQCARALPGPDGGTWIEPSVFTLEIDSNKVIRCYDFLPINTGSELAASRGL